MHELRISSDPADVDLDAVHAFISRSYWAEGIPRETLARAIANSIPFSALLDGRQVGFARLVTDRATFAYLADVYVLEECRGRGYGKRLMEAVMAHPDVQGIRRFLLVTRDAHALYRPFGFVPVVAPDRHMEITRPGIYKGSVSPDHGVGTLDATRESSGVSRQA